MRRALPELLLASLAALALLALGGLTPAFTDYEREAEPAVRAFLAGDLAGFAQALPSYGGAVALRLPFAWAADALGGGDLAVFRALAVPCLLAGALLAAHEAARLRRAGRPRGERLLVAGLLAANPLTIRALDAGHPEEVLVAVLAIAAVLATLAGRHVPAGLLLGAAVAAKPWAVVCVGPVLLGCGAWRPALRCAAASVPAALVVAAPVLLGGSGLTEAGAVARDAGQVFWPQQWLWFLGDPGVQVVGEQGVREGYRAAPGWAGTVTKPLVVLAALALSALAAWRGPRDARAVLALLAAVLLLRCTLDTWNFDYYAVPALLALVVLEARTRPGPPVLALGATLAAWLTLWQLDLAPDALAALYLAWTVPLVAFLATLAVRRPRTAREVVRPRSERVAVPA